MSKTVRFLFAGCMLFHGGFVKAGDATGSTVVVKVYNPAGFEESTLASAERIVTDIFRRLGVGLVWERAVALGRLDSGPEDEGRRSDLWIHLVADTATVMGGDIHKAGLATGVADGRSRSRIWVFRPILETVIENTVSLTTQKNPQRLRSVLLAQVMAHEMGHVLLGSAKHSEAGIMKASFDLAAIRLACTGGLAFSRTESRNIRAAVQTMNEAAFGRTPVSCSETMSPATADNSCHAGVSEVMRRSKLRLMQHEYSGALVGFEQALKVVERDCVADDFQAGLILLDMGGTDHLLNRNAAAERCYRRALAIFNSRGSPADESGAIARVFLGKLLMLDRRMSEAEALFEQAIPVLQICGNQDRRYLGGALINLAEAYRTDGRYFKAEPLYRRVLQMVQIEPYLRSAEINAGLGRFAPMLRKMKRKAEARVFSREIKALLSE